MSYFRLNEHASKRLFVVDNFYADPYGVRDVALSMEFKQDIRFYKGYRSTESYISQEIKEALDKINKRLDKLEVFKADTIKDINGLDDAVEKLEDFRFKAIDDINDIFDDLSIIENSLEMGTDD